MLSAKKFNGRLSSLISTRYHNVNTQSHGFEISRDLTKRYHTIWWIETLLRVFMDGYTIYEGIPLDPIV